MVLMTGLIKKNPNEWKTSKLVLLGKPRKSKEEIYLINVISKTYERLMPERLKVEVSDKLPGYQYRFRKDSCTIAVMKFVFEKAEKKKKNAYKNRHPVVGTHH